jgi:hypothetical protein
MSEIDLMRRVQVMASQFGMRLFRNNVGMGWIGKSTRISTAVTLRLEPGDVVIRQARPLHAGLCEGSSDLIGFQPLEIKEKHVGQVFAVFSAVETKMNGGRTSAVQQNFIQMIQNAGGIGFVCRDEDSFKERFQWTKQLILKG